MEDGIERALERFDRFDAFVKGQIGCDPSNPMYSQKVVPSKHLIAYCERKRYAIDNKLGEWYQGKNGDYDFVMQMTPPQIAAKMQSEAVARKRRIASEILATGIPVAYQDANLETNTQGKPMIRDAGNVALLDIAGKYLTGWTQGRRGIIVSGQMTGCGKTYALCAVGRALAVKGASVRFIKIGSLLGMLRDSYANKVYNERTRSAQQIMSEYAGAQVLILDDLGAEKLCADETGDWTREKIFELIDSRVAANVTTFGTTNLTKASILNHYGDRIYSRMVSLMAWVPVKGPDRRSADDPFASDDEGDTETTEI